MDKTCNCQVQGIAILPVRYTVVPTYINRPQPNWANLPSVTTIPLSEGYQYHVRSLREGYLYVYLPAERGNDKWQVYSIDDQGRLLKQLLNSSSQPINETQKLTGYSCPELKSNKTHGAFITIPSPQYQKTIYIAYSEFKWSEKNLKKYELNPSQRMQEVNLTQWHGTATSAIKANQDNVEKILDFDPNFDKQILPYDQNKFIKLSKDNENGQKGIIFEEKLSGDRTQHYELNKKLLDLNSTCEPWPEYTSHSSECLSQSMQTYSPNNIPMILAIEDSVGTVTELNGYYNDLYTYILQHQQERALEYGALAYFEQAKSLIAQKKMADDYKFTNTVNPYIKTVMQSGKIPNQSSQPVTCISRGLDALIREHLYGKAGSWSYYNQFEKFRMEMPSNKVTLSNYYGNLSEHEKIVQWEQGNLKRYVTQAEIERSKIQLTEKYQQVLDKFITNENVLLEKRKQEINEGISKYQELINTKPFEEKCEELTTLVDKNYEIRVQQLINWIKLSSFYVTVYHDIDGNELDELDNLDNNNHQKLKNLIETHEKNLQESLTLGDIEANDLEDLRQINIQGIIFHNVIDKAIRGLELCKTGKAFIDPMKDLKYAVPYNEDVNGMLWRMLAYHNDNLLSLIEQVITEAQTQEDNFFTENDIEKQEFRLKNLPYNKIAIKFKYLQDVIMTLEELNHNDPRNTIKTKFLGFIKIKEFTMGEMSSAKLMQSLQPTFDKLCDKLYSASTLMFKTLALATAGVLRGSAFCYLQLEYQFITALITMDKGPNLGTASVPIYLNRWNLRTRAAVEKTRLLLNDAMVRLDQRITLAVNRIFPQAKANRLFYLGFKASKGDIGISNSMANSLKSTRLAVVVAMFEIYNFNSISKSNPTLEKNEWYMTLKLSAGFALAAAGVEIMAMVTAVAKGTRHIAFGLGKALSGTLGGIAAFFNAIHSFQRARKEKNNGNIGLSILLYLSSFFSFVAGASSTLATLSYHFIWCRSLLTNRVMFSLLKSLGTGVAVKKIASIAALRLVLWRLTGLIGIVIMAIEIVFYWLSDDNLETWLKRCGLRTDKYIMPHNTSHIYQTPQQQAEAFDEEVLQDMFNLNENESQKTNHIEDIISLSDALALIEEDIDQRGLLYA